MCIAKLSGPVHDLILAKNQAEDFKVLEHAAFSDKNERKDASGDLNLLLLDSSFSAGFTDMLVQRAGVAVQNRTESEIRVPVPVPPPFPRPEPDPPWPDPCKPDPLPWPKPGCPDRRSRD